MGNEVRTKTIDQQGIKLEQQLLINRTWSKTNNYWSTGNEARTKTTDQQGMKLERQLLIKGWKLELQLLINREWS